MSNPPLHLVVALDGAGWHPGAWREPDARPDALLSGRFWVDLAQRAESGLIDFLTIEDGLNLQSESPWEPDSRVDQVRGRLDAVLIASRIAPATAHVGLVPTVLTTHTEPFHISKAIATLDYVSLGRAGVRVQIAGRSDTARHFGRRDVTGYLPDRRDDPEVQRIVADHFEEAADYVEVLRRLWDSWEDGAEIRDVATGRFIDRQKLHYIDFTGRWFSVKGPSITPRPPQGSPLVAALGHAAIPYRLIGRSADVGFITPHDAAEAARIVAEIRREQVAAGRADVPVHVFGDLVVLLDETRAAAHERKARLDERSGTEYRSDAHVFVGTPVELAELLLAWQESGLTGYRLRPAALPHDLARITEGLVRELQRRGAFRTEYGAGSLRQRLGLPRPANRYAA